MLCYCAGFQVALADNVMQCEPTNSPLVVVKEHTSLQMLLQGVSSRVHQQQCRHETKDTRTQAQTHTYPNNV